MVDYTKYSLHRLHSALAQAEKEERDHDSTTPEVGQEAAHKNQLKLIQQRISDIDDEISRREKEKEEKEEAKVKAASVSGGQPVVVQAATGGGVVNNGQLQVQIKLVENAVSELKVFGSGDEVSTFVRDVQNIAHLADCDLTKKYMLNRLFTRLSPEYQTRYRAYVATNSITTVDGFLSYIKETYSSCKSIFQHFELLDNFEMGDSETSLRDYASRLQNEIFEIETVIKSKYATVAKKKDSSSNGTLDESALFKLLTGMVFLRTLKKDRELYNHVISRIDDCLDATEIANIAEAFKERKQSDDPLLSHVAPVVNHVNKGGRDDKKGREQKNVPCFRHFENKCTKGNRCPYSHEKTSLKELNEHGYQKYKAKAAKYNNVATKKEDNEDKLLGMGAAYVHGASGFQY